VSEVSVSELKSRASEIIRDVREQGTRYVITHRRRPVGLLIPLEEAGSVAVSATGDVTSTTWNELVRLGEEIGRGWRSPSTGAEVLSEMRR
jgi:prevent-host-death family protein